MQAKINTAEQRALIEVFNSFEAATEELNNYANSKAFYDHI
jgi:hypothetical protein